MRAGYAVLLSLAACGRLGFDAGSSSISGDAQSDDDGGTTLAWPQLEETAAVELTGYAARVVWNGAAFAVFSSLAPLEWFYTTYSPDGTLLDGPQPIAVQSVHHVFLRGTELVTIHTRGSEIVLATVAQDGTVTNERVLQEGYLSYVHEVAGDRLCMAWRQVGSNVIRVAVLDRDGTQLTTPALVHDSDAEGTPSRIWCDGDEIRMVGTDAITPSIAFYKASGVDGSTRVPRTAMTSSRPGTIQIRDAVLGNTSSPVIIYYLGGAAGDNVTRITPLALDGSTVTLDGTETAVPLFHRTAWMGDRFAITWSATQSPATTTLSYATMSSTGLLLDAEVPIGRSLADAADLPTAQSYARSPDGHTAIGVGVSDFVTEVKAYVSFLAPQ